MTSSYLSVASWPSASVCGTPTVHCELDDSETPPSLTVVEKSKEALDPVSSSSLTYTIGSG